MPSPRVFPQESVRYTITSFKSTSASMSHALPTKPSTIIDPVDGSQLGRSPTKFCHKRLALNRVRHDASPCVCPTRHCPSLHHCRLLHLGLEFKDSSYQDQRTRKAGITSSDTARSFTGMPLFIENPREPRAPIQPPLPHWALAPNCPSG